MLFMNHDPSVTVSSPGNKPFRGFILRARRLVGNTEQLVGNFIEYSEKTSKGKSYYPLKDGENV